MEGAPAVRAMRCGGREVLLFGEEDVGGPDEGAPGGRGGEGGAGGGAGAVGGAELDDVFEASPGSAGGTSPLGGDDDYSVFGRATMKAQSAALVQVRGGERRSGAPARRPPLKTRGPLRGALRVGRPLAPKSLNPQD